MPITVTCPSCSQMCQVEDKYAGQMVRCPKCGNIIQATRPGEAAAPAVAVPPPAAPMPIPPAPPGPPPGPPGPGVMETIQQSAAIFGLDALSLKLIYAGLGCFAAMILFTLFPWVTVFNLATVLGINMGSGAFNLLLTLGAGGFMVVVFLVLKQPKFFDYSLWTAAGWSAFASIWRLVGVFHYGGAAGIGLYLTLLASLGAAGAFGYLVYQRVIKKKV